MKKMLSMSAVAEIIGVSRWTLRWWVKKGQGPHFKKSPGGRYLFREEDVRRWIDNLEGPAAIRAPERKDAAQAAA